MSLWRPMLLAILIALVGVYVITTAVPMLLLCTWSLK